VVQSFQAVVVEDRAEIEPAPADHLEIGEVGLPELVRAACFVPELVGGPDHHMGWCRDQILGAEDAIHGGFRHEVPLLVSIFDRQFPGRQVFVLQGKADDIFANRIRDAVPDRRGPGRAIGKRIDAAIAPARVPVVIGAAGDTEHLQGLPGRQMRRLDRADDLELL